MNDEEILKQIYNKDEKDYFFPEDVKFALGVNRPRELSVLYFNNEPTVTLHPDNFYVTLSVITDDEVKRILMTPQQAKGLGKTLHKYLKKYAKQITGEIS